MITTRRSRRLCQEDSRINFDELPAAAPARAKPDLRRWDSEMLRDGGDDRVIGGAIDWRCGYPDVQHAIVP